MAGQQEFVHIFDVPTDEAAKEKLMGFLDEIDQRIKGWQGISIMGKNVSSTTEFRQASQAAVKGIQDMDTAEKELMRTRTQSQLQRQQNMTAMKDEIKLNQAAEGSIARLRIELKQAQAAYDAMSASQRKAAEGQELLKSIQGQDKALKELEGSTGRYQRNVGNYTGAVQTLTRALDEAKAKLDQFTRSGQSNDAEERKLQEEVAMLTTLVGQQSKGFASLTMEVRSGERALQTMRAAGMEGTQAFEQMQLQVAESARGMREFQKSQKLLESGAPVLQSMTIAAKGLGGLYATGAGAAALFADGNEKVEKELNKLVAVMTILQGLNEVHELLEKKGAIATTFHTAAIKLKNFVMTGSTQETAKNTVATEENAVAQEEGAAATTTAARAMTALRFALIATGIGALLVLLPVFADAMSKAADATARAAADAEALKEVTDKASDSYAEELVKVQAVQKELQDENLSHERKKKIIDDLKEEYPQYLQNISDEEGNSAKLAATITDKLIPALMAQAKAKAALQLITDKTKEMLQIENNMGEGEATFWNKATAGIGVYLQSLGFLSTGSALMKKGVNDAIQNSKDRLADLQKQIESLWKIYLTNDEKIVPTPDKKAAEDFTDYEEGFKQLREEFAKFQQEARGLNVDAYTKSLQDLFQKYQDASIKINDTRDKDLAKVKENEKKGILTTSQAAAERTKIEKDTAETRLQVQDAYYANLNALQDKHRSEIAAKQKEQADKDFKEALENQQRIAKALGEQADTHFRQQVTVAKNNVSADPSIKNKKALADAERDEQLRSQTKLLQEQKITQVEFDSDVQAIQLDHSKKMIDIYTQEFTKYSDLAKNALGAVDNLEKAVHERKIQRIQQQMEASSRLRDTEVQNIEASTMSASQKAAQTAALNARNAATQKTLQLEENKEKRKQAEMDRVKAVFDISASTARAIMEAVAASPETGGLPWSAVAAALGGAELAAVLKQPLPQYAVGTDYHPGGPMIVHPGELRIDPGGQVSMTPDKPTLTMGAPGTKIIPADEVNQMIIGQIFSSTARMIARDNNLEQKIDELKDTIRLASQAQVSAMRNQKPPVVNVYNDSAFQAYIDKAVRN